MSQNHWLLKAEAAIFIFKDKKEAIWRLAKHLPINILADTILW